jgi:hypothetical protein
MKNFEVHELNDGWSGQVGTLEEAIQLRDSIIRDYGAENVLVKITAEVDEDDLKRERLLNHWSSWIDPQAPPRPIPCGITNDTDLGPGPTEEEYYAAMIERLDEAGVER